MCPWIVLIIALNVNKVSANKYCSLESNGEPKYFICARNEYCCHFGCCVHLAFQFYQLWYYWLLLIFMFMLCSGGSWWYKFCRHHETSTYPSLPPSFERQARQTFVDSRRNRSVDRNTADNSFYFQRIWKANGMGPPPNYYTASVVRYHSASELETRRQQQECPYYQLYGPPPSYESVVRIPENGYGQPSCTLVASTPVPSQQTTTSYLTNIGNSISSNNLTTISGGHIVMDTQQQQQQQQQQQPLQPVPMPSTSVQTGDFFTAPVQTDSSTTKNRNNVNRAAVGNTDKHLITISVGSGGSDEGLIQPGTTASTSSTCCPITPATGNQNDSKDMAKRSPGEQQQPV